MCIGTPESTLSKSIQNESESASFSSFKSIEQEHIFKTVERMKHRFLLAGPASVYSLLHDQIRVPLNDKGRVVLTLATPMSEEVIKENNYRDFDLNVVPLTTAFCLF